MTNGGSEPPAANRAVYKFPLRNAFEAGRGALTMPAGSKVVHFGMQGDVPTLWAWVDTTAIPVRRLFALVGTGHPLPDYIGLEHVGTAMHGEFVWHLFEMRQ